MHTAETSTSFTAYPPHFVFHRTRYPLTPRRLSTVVTSPCTPPGSSQKLWFRPNHGLFHRRDLPHAWHPLSPRVDEAFRYVPRHGPLFQKTIKPKCSRYHPHLLMLGHAVQDPITGRARLKAPFPPTAWNPVICPHPTRPLFQKSLSHKQSPSLPLTSIHIDDHLQALL